MTEASYQDRINKAHEDGHLFVHMFESSMEDTGALNLRNLFRVMDGEDGVHYDSPYGHKYQTRPDGVVGLSVTAIKKEFPVPLFPAVGSVGLLMDTARPMFVCSTDHYSRVEGDNISFIGYEEVPQLRKIQGFKDAGGEQEKGTYAIGGDISKRCALGEAALKALWEHIRTVGWYDYIAPYGVYKGMNEVNAAVKLGDVCGIVINQNHAMDFAESVREAVEIRRHLMKEYAGVFTSPLPILSYKIQRSQDAPQPQLVPLDEQSIAQIVKRGSDLSRA